MTSATFERLVARLVAAGAVYLKGGGVHVEADTWRALTNPERRALVARRDAIRELLNGAVEGSSERAHGLGSRRSQAGNANGDGAIRPIDNPGVATVSPDIEDSAGRGGSSTASERDGSTAIEHADSTHRRGSESLSKALPSVEVKSSGRVQSGRPASGEGSRRGDSGETGETNLVPSAKGARPVAIRPTKNRKVKAGRSTPGRPVLRGRARVDVESLEWARRRIERHNSRERLTTDDIRRDAERDFDRLGELHLDARGWR